MRDLFNQMYLGKIDWICKIFLFIELCTKRMVVNRVVWLSASMPTTRWPFVLAILYIHKFTWKCNWYLIHDYLGIAPTDRMTELFYIHVKSWLENENSFSTNKIEQQWNVWLVTLRNLFSVLIYLLLMFFPYL